MVELYLNSPIRFHGAVLPLPLPYSLLYLSCYVYDLPLHVKCANLMSSSLQMNTRGAPCSMIEFDYR
jgi:hypothetical protein